jgi:hypothetical protein
MNEDTVVRVDGVTCTIRVFLSMGKVKQTAEGGYITTGKLPHEPLEIPPEAFSQNTHKPDPYSLLGLQMRGYRVLVGKTVDDNRVEVGGGFYRITEARKHGLI